MASIHRDPRTNTFLLMFRYGGKQYRKSLNTKNEAEADGLRGGVVTTLLELKRGRRTLPPDADLWEFLISDGQRTRKAEAPTVVTLDQLFARYEEAMPPGAMEANSLYTINIHKKHLVRLLGGRTPVTTLGPSTVQVYINGRAKEEYRGKTISSRTIKKEVTTLRSVWNWGKDHELVTGDAPTKGLRYEKENPKPGFMTWAEIEKRVGRGGLSAEQERELWDALFLDKVQIAECLEHVRTTSDVPFVYPMFVFVAHTGARRSEIIRSRVEDINFEARKVLIREKKKNRRKTETERYVEMSTLLERVMRDWLEGEHHPGGPFTFCQTEVVGRSKKRSRTTGHQSGPDRAKTLSGRKATVRERTERPGHAPLTKDEATYYFNRALAGSKWAVVRGFHVFRHSFASNMAREGVAQGIIDSHMGHQTEEMRKRYQHLFPQEREKAIRSVFG